MSLSVCAVNAKPYDSGLTRCFNVSFLGFVVGFQCDPRKLAQTAFHLFLFLRVQIVASVCMYLSSAEFLNTLNVVRIGRIVCRCTFADTSQVFMQYKS